MGLPMALDPAEIRQAEGLISAAQTPSRASADGLAKAAADEETVTDASGGDPASATVAVFRGCCRSCRKGAEQLCAANGCCGRCIFEIQHFERLGSKVMSQPDAVELERAGGVHAHTYGEVTPLGFRDLCERIDLHSDDIFVDCGSGTGRLVIQAVQEYGVRMGIGVELSRGRHNAALELASKAHASHKPINERTHFICADCAAPHLWTVRSSGATPSTLGTADGALAGATVVFTCSIMFDVSLMVCLLHPAPPTASLIHPLILYEAECWHLAPRRSASPHASMRVLRCVP